MSIDLLFHRQLHALAERPIEWSEALKCWCVFQPRQVKSLFESSEAIAVPYGDQLSTIGSKWAVELRGPLQVLQHIPLANEGETHLKSRRTIAQLHNATYEDRLTKLRSEIALRKYVWEISGSIELTENFFHPVIHAITMPFSQALLSPTWPGPSQLFDRFLSLQRRKDVYGQINMLYEEGLQRLEPHLDEKIAMRILGYDALLGSIQESFVSQVRLHKSVPLNEIPWPDKLPATAVPTVERIAQSDIEIGGKHISKGQRIRLFLNGSDVDQGLFFGDGRHKCVGAGISQKIWQEFVQLFSALTCYVTIENIEYPQSDFVFNCPKKLHTLLRVI